MEIGDKVTVATTGEIVGMERAPNGQTKYTIRNDKIEQCFVYGYSIRIQREGAMDGTTNEEISSREQSV